MQYPLDLQVKYPSEVPDTPSNYAHETLVKLKTAYAEVRKNLDVAQRRQKTYYDKGKVNKGYEIGDKVYLCDKLAKFNEPKWTGPFVILEQVTCKTYKVQPVNDPQMASKTVSHDLLKPCLSQTVTRIQPPRHHKPVFLSDTSNSDVDVVPDDDSSQSDSSTTEGQPVQPVVPVIPPPIQQAPLCRGTHAHLPPNRYGDMVVDLNTYTEDPEASQLSHLKYLQILEREVQHVLPQCMHGTELS